MTPEETVLCNLYSIFLPHYSNTGCLDCKTPRADNEEETVPEFELRFSCGNFTGLNYIFFHREFKAPCQSREEEKG